MFHFFMMHSKSPRFSNFWWRLDCAWCDVKSAFHTLLSIDGYPNRHLP